jgi:hypothetical protein
MGRPFRIYYRAAGEVATVGGGIVVEITFVFFEPSVFHRSN